MNNELNKISNENLLSELKKRLDKGEIKIRGNELIGKIGENTGYIMRLDLDVGKFVNEVINELQGRLEFEERWRLAWEERQEFEIQKEIDDYSKTKTAN